MRYIYFFKNIVNNKIYVGQTNNISKRQRDHLRDAQNGHESLLCRGIRKYGQDNFEFKVIEECQDESANEREKYWIDHFDSFNSGYNQTTGGDHFKHSEETKRKIGNFFKGKKLSEEHKKKVAAFFTGKKRPPPSEETLKKRSESLKGKNTKPKSEEHKRKLSEAKKGKKLSEEQKKRLAELRKPISEETRKKISEAGKGRIVSEETKRKISEAQKGRSTPKQSKETIEKRILKLRGQKRSESSRQNIRDGIRKKKEEKEQQKKLIIEDAKDSNENI
jgi:group I intron endonuclease